MDVKLDIKEMIRLAFWAAHERGKPDWWRMTTAVLKNRLLTLTDRQFSEADYGARTLIEFASKFPELISIDTTTYPPEVALRPTRIKPDLWRAAIDYRSGTVYVWDPVHQRARERTVSDNAALQLPTLTKDHLTRWRADFAERQRPTVTSSETAALENWVQHGLATQQLPERLKDLWKREQSWRVWEHLSSWFARHVPEAERPTIAEAPETPKRGLRARLVTIVTRPEGEVVAEPESDVVRQCRDAGDWLAVGEMLSAKFVGAPTSELEANFAKVVAAWAAPVHPLSVESIHDLIAHLNEIAPEQAATAVVN